MFNFNEMENMLRGLINETIANMQELKEQVEMKELEVQEKGNEIDKIVEQLAFMEVLKAQLIESKEALENEKVELEMQLEDLVAKMNHNKLGNLINEFRNKGENNN